MRLVSLARLAVVAVPALALGGCLDASVAVMVTGQDAAEVVVTQTMDADFYAMMQLNAEKAEEGEAAEFCAGGTLSENQDRSVTCTLGSAGDFPRLIEASGGVLELSSEADGTARIELALPRVRELIGAAQESAGGQEMLDAFFSGHELTVSFGGGEILDSNMEPAEDGSTVAAVIPLLDIINGTGDWPEVLYAVVAVP